MHGLEDRLGQPLLHDRLAEDVGAEDLAGASRAVEADGGRHVGLDVPDRLATHGVSAHEDPSGRTRRPGVVSGAGGVTVRTSYTAGVSGALPSRSDCVAYPSQVADRGDLSSWLGGGPAPEPGSGRGGGWACRPPGPGSLAPLGRRVGGARHRLGRVPGDLGRVLRERPGRVPAEPRQPAGDPRRSSPWRTCSWSARSVTPSGTGSSGLRVRRVFPGQTRDDAERGRRWRPGSSARWPAPSCCASWSRRSSGTPTGEDCTTGWPGRRSSGADRSGGGLPHQAVPPVEASAPPHAGQDRRARPSAPRRSCASGSPHRVRRAPSRPRTRSATFAAGTAARLSAASVRRADAGEPDDDQVTAGGDEAAEPPQPGVEVEVVQRREARRPGRTARPAGRRGRRRRRTDARVRLRRPARATWSGSRSSPVTRATPARAARASSSPSPHPTSSALDAPRGEPQGEPVVVRVVVPDGVAHRPRSAAAHALAVGARAHRVDALRHGEPDAAERGEPLVHLGDLLLAQLRAEPLDGARQLAQRDLALAVAAPGCSVIGAPEMTRAVRLRSASSSLAIRGAGPSPTSTTPGRPTPRNTRSCVRGSTATGSCVNVQPRRMVPQRGVGGAGLALDLRVRGRLRATGEDEHRREQPRTGC